jgi:CBS domain containing-hemolysin-like protein
LSLFIIILISLALSAFFSGMEIAFVSANKLRLELDKKQGVLSSRIISIYTNNPGQYIVTMLIGNNIALVVYGIVMAIILEPLIVQFTQSEVNILLIQTLVSTLIILFTAEFLPKTVFRMKPNTFLNLFSIPVFLFYILFYPISLFTITLSDLILRLFFKTKQGDNQKMSIFSKIDLDHLVNVIQEEAEPEDEIDYDIKIFQNALDFANVKVRECMVPRTEIIAFEENTKLQEIKQSFIETGLSKIIIYRETIDHVVGYINVKELFKKPSDIKSSLVPLSIVPETMPANRLLELLMSEQKSIALVVDEFGGTSGIVTIEDILEEIFGEIEDEHDQTYLVDKKTGKNDYIFSGRLEIDLINEKYNLGLPERDEYETMAGLILYHHESLPAVNEVISIDHFDIRILKVTKTRLELVKLHVREY